MAYPRKTKGYRRITIDGARYRWRFDTNSHETYVTLQGGDHSGQQAAIVLTDVPNWWLEFPHGDERPVVVLPRHVAPLIRLALDWGWTPDTKKAPIRVPVSWEHMFGDEPV